MMKKIFTLLSAFAIVLIAFSCEDNFDTVPQYEEAGGTLTVTPSTATVTMTSANAQDSVIAFDWNDPGYSVGLEQTKFTIRLGVPGTNFATSQSVSVEGVLKGYIVGETLNGMALALGAEPGEATPFEVQVQASHLNNNEPILSEPLTITITPYTMLALVPTVTEVETSFDMANEQALSLSWNTAFAGFSGPASYEFQYAEGGTAFANPTVVAVTNSEFSFTHKELRNLALAHGGEAGVSSPVDFRIMATNEFGNVEYSNVVTVDVIPYDVPNVLYPAIGIIGAGVGGWDTDIDLYRVGGDDINQWYTRMYISAGDVKFRANDNWDVNWGNSAFPSGTGTQGGSNIPVANAGYYEVAFNAETGAYSFTPIATETYATVGVIGPATPGGWDNDTDLTQDANDDNIWTGVLALTAGEIKFRADNGWDDNWGAGDLTTSISGFGDKGGNNLSIPADGTYFVYINTATGEYWFGHQNNDDPYNDIGVIGSATPGGWDNDTNINKNPYNPYKWSGFITLTAAEAKFRADNLWDNNWGSSEFPIGVGTPGGANIPIDEAGTYFVNFNTATGEYIFTK